MSDGIHGHGASLNFSDGTNTTAVGNIISISGPNQARDAIDISTMDSTSKWREKIPGMLDAGECTLEVNYDGTAAGVGNFLSAQMTATQQTWTMTLNGTATSSWACVGFMTGLGFAVPYDDKVTQSVSLAFTGVPTYTDEA
jgi:predicted secreted protein